MNKWRMVGAVLVVAGVVIIVVGKPGGLEHVAKVAEDAAEAAAAGAAAGAATGAASAAKAAEQTVN